MQSEQVSFQIFNFRSMPSLSSWVDDVAITILWHLARVRDTSLRASHLVRSALRANNMVRDRLLLFMDNDGDDDSSLSVPGWVWSPSASFVDDDA